MAGLFGLFARVRQLSLEQLFVATDCHEFTRSAPLDGRPKRVCDCGQRRRMVSRQRRNVDDDCTADCCLYYLSTPVRGQFYACGYQMIRFQKC